MSIVYGWGDKTLGRRREKKKGSEEIELFLSFWWRKEAKEGHFLQRRAKERSKKKNKKKKKDLNTQDYSLSFPWTIQQARRRWPACSSWKEKGNFDSDGEKEERKEKRGRRKVCNKAARKKLRKEYDLYLKCLGCMYTLSGWGWFENTVNGARLLFEEEQKEQISLHHREYCNLF